MASTIRIKAASAVQTSHAVAADAECLRVELASLTREWDDVVAGWSGGAASAYAALWEDWHNGATKLVDTLMRSSQLLEHAAITYGEQESISTRSVSSL